MTARDLADLITQWLDDGAKPCDTLLRLENEFGARWDPEGTTESLTYRGVRATCSEGGYGLLRNWCAAAGRGNQIPVSAVLS